ncbi:RraA family protein [Cupriavidus alkaliphilus]|nr:hypothetical protein [Cupriavidus alkaliphilus]MBB2917073.1 regulator of RNase E activity RraA [Cupriavidus alkaliphilus]
MTGLARKAGVVGAIFDGSCRDTDEATFLGFPISAKPPVCARPTRR